MWIQSHTQWIGGGLGLIGLNYDAVEREAGRNEIKLNRCIWKKIKALEAFELSRQTPEKKEKDVKNDSRGRNYKRGFKTKTKPR